MIEIMYGFHQQMTKLLLIICSNPLEVWPSIGIGKIYSCLVKKEARMNKGVVLPIG